MSGGKWIRAAREGRMLRDKAGRFMVPRVVRTGVSLAAGDQERRRGRPEVERRTWAEYLLARWGGR